MSKLRGVEESTEGLWRSFLLVIAIFMAVTLVSQFIIHAELIKHRANSLQGLIAALCVVNVGILLLLGLGIIRPALRQLQISRNTLSEREAFYRLMTDYSTDMISRYDPQGVFRYVSPSCYTILGYNPQELLNRSGYDLVHPEDTHLLSPQTIMKLYRVRHKEGHYVWLESTIQAVRDRRSGQIVEFVVVSRDVSSRIAAQQELTEARHVAETASQAKSQFLANMSHELRTPLNAILGFTELIQQDSNLTSDQQRHLEIVANSGSYLLLLINNVLEISKIEAGQLIFNPMTFDLKRLLVDLENMFTLRAGAKQLQLEFEGLSNLPRYVYGDEVKLRQVVLNLLSNALKFTEQGGVLVHVHYQYEPHQPIPEGLSEDAKGGLLFLEVRDTGLGIAAEELPKLFRAFAQTAAGRQSSEGTGLGLALTREYVQLMKGTIRVESQLGHGSKFFVELPIPCLPRSEQTPTHGLSLKQHVVGTKGTRQYKVLVVEDRSDSRYLMMKLMLRAGIDTREAVNGKEAVDMGLEWQPDLIWMDIDMPMMNGMEATRQLLAKGSKAVIIALTASAFEHERQAVMEAGCHDYLSKPIRLEKVYNLMTRHLGIEFLYDTSEVTPHETTPPRGHDKVDISSLPPDLLPRLKKAAINLELHQINVIIGEIQYSHTELALTLAAWVKQYRFDKIQQLTEVWEKQGSKP